MAHEEVTQLDVAIIGGGPAGIFACLELSKSLGLRMALFESEAELGGIPRACHIGFGMRDQRRIYTGPAYARKLSSLITKTSVEIHTKATVLNIIPGSPGKVHRLKVSTEKGLRYYESRFIVLATGCCEAPRAVRDLPGERPAGIFTTGTLQQMVNLHHLKPGERAVIIGSEHVAFSSILSLKQSRTSIAAMVEEDLELETYTFIAKAMSFSFKFPIYKGVSVKAILGNKRVEGVELAKKGGENSFLIECDTIIITGKFRPISSLIDDTLIARDPSSGGPVVDMNLMTSIANIFAAGNILRGADMSDLCALEGKLVGQSISKKTKSNDSQMKEFIYMRAESPIRYVVPQKIAPTQIDKPLFSWFYPGFAAQLEHTLKNSVLEAWSGDEKIWEHRFSKLIGHNRIPIPVWKFDWNRVNPKKEVVVKIRDSNA